MYVVRSFATCYTQPLYFGSNVQKLMQSIIEQNQQHANPIHLKEASFILKRSTWLSIYVLKIMKYIILTQKQMNVKQSLSSTLRIQCATTLCNADFRFDVYVESQLIFQCEISSLKQSSAEKWHNHLMPFRGSSTTAQVAQMQRGHSMTEWSGTLDRFNKSAFFKCKRRLKSA